MIGFGLGFPDYGYRPPEGRHRVLDMTPQQQSDIVKLLVRYRIARRAPWFVVNPCPVGQLVCIRSETP